MRKSSDENKEEKTEVPEKPSKTCPPPKGPGKHPSEVSQTLIDRAMGKYAKVDGDPGEGCVSTPYVAGKTESVCTIGYGHQIPGCTVLSRETGKRPTAEEISNNKVRSSRPPEFYCSCEGTEFFDCKGPEGEQQVRSDAAVKAKYVNEVVPVDLNQKQFDALVDLALHRGSIPSDLLTAIKSYWCTDEGKNYVRSLYLKSALTPFPKAFAARRQYRVWPAVSTREPAPRMSLWDQSQRALEKTRDVLRMGVDATSEEKRTARDELWAVIGRIEHKQKAGFAHAEEEMTIRSLKGQLLKEIGKLMDLGP